MGYLLGVLHFSAAGPELRPRLFLNRVQQRRPRRRAAFRGRPAPLLEHTHAISRLLAAGGGLAGRRLVYSFSLHGASRAVIRNDNT